MGVCPGTTAGCLAFHWRRRPARTILSAIIAVEARVTEWLARILVDAASLYAGVGVLAALWISFRGLHRLGPVAANGTWGFRLLILPGLTALWPLMLARCVRGEGRPPTERTAHRRLARPTGPTR